MRFLFLWIVLIRKASSQNGYHPFIPFDPVIDQNRIENQFHPSVIHLDDNQTEIIQYSPNEIYMKKIDPLTKKSVIINLSKLPVDFKEENVNSNGAEGQNMESPLKREVPILEWSPILAKGDTPIKRRGHSIVSIDEMLIVFGGCYLDEKCFNDLHIFDIKSNEWREEKAQGNKPKERAGQTATLFGSKMYVFGGGGREGYLNDLFVLDIETFTWTELYFSGIIPSSRVNHGAVLDNKARIIIFGGYTNDGYSNDVFFIDINNERFEKPILSGNPPPARESFSINIIRDKLWIFGGYTIGKTLDDFYILDLNFLTWNKLATFGESPTPRQGHLGLKHGKELFIIGGCNYKLNQCYKDTYLLNTETLYWTKLQDFSQTILTAREGHSGTVVGKFIFVFGGCELFKTCNNDLIIMNTNIECPFACWNKGICRNSMCVCYQSYQGNDCSTQVICLNDCSLHGVCLSDAKCSCYPGYSGVSCEIFIQCPNNCTSEENGICQKDGTCKCKEGLKGSSCDEKISLADINNTNIKINKNNQTEISFDFDDNEKTNETINEDIGLDDLKINVTSNQLKLNNSSPESKANISSIKESKNLSNINETHIPSKSYDNFEAFKKKLNIKIENNKDNKNSTDNTKIENEIATIKTMNPNKSESKETSKKKINSETNNSSENSNSLEKENSSQIKNETYTKISKTQPLNIINISLTPNISDNNKTQSEKFEKNEKETPKSEETEKVKEEKKNTESEKQNNTDTSNSTIKRNIFGVVVDRKINSFNNITSAKKIQNIHDCPNSCSFNGYCINKQCYCREGTLGSDCSFSKLNQLKEGERLSDFSIYSGVSLFSGFLVGCVTLYLINARTKEAEFHRIDND